MHGWLWKLRNVSTKSTRNTGRGFHFYIIWATRSRKSLQLTQIVFHSWQALVCSFITDRPNSCILPCVFCSGNFWCFHPVLFSLLHYFISPADNIRLIILGHLGSNRTSWSANIISWQALVCISKRFQTLFSRQDVLSVIISISYSSPAWGEKHIIHKLLWL